MEAASDDGSMRAVRFLTRTSVYHRYSTLTAAVRRGPDGRDWRVARMQWRQSLRRAFLSGIGGV